MFVWDFIVSCLLCISLSSPYFLVRQKAEESLREMGLRAEPALLIFSNSDDPEQRLRVNRCLNHIFPAVLDRMFARNHFDGGVPWCDSLPKDHPLRRELYQLYSYDSRVDKQVKHEAKPFPEYRAVTRIWLTDRIYTGDMTIQQAELLLQSMVLRSELWINNKWTDIED